MSDDTRQTLWHATREIPPHPPLEGQARVEVAIVGAGITGLTVARLLVQEGRQVAVIEQGRIGSGTTGGTTAHVTQVPDRRFRELISSFNREDVRMVVDSSRVALERIASFVEEDGIDCDFTRIPAYLYTELETKVADLQREAEAAGSVGMPATFVREVPLPFPVAGAVRFEDQARFHPTAYLAGLARKVTDAGMRIYEGTRVVNVQDGEPCRVETDHGTILADRVLFATHTPAGFTLLHAELEPLRSYVLAVRLRDQEVPDGLFFDTAEPYNYTRKQPTGRGDLLIVGGQDHKVGDEGEPPASDFKLEEYVRRHWNVESVEHRWSAQLYDPPDGLPLIGESLTSSRVFLATGYSGTGMTFGTLGGMLLADLALGRGNPWAGLYRPSRIRPLTAIPEIAKLNVQSAASFIKDRIEIPRVRDLSEVPAGQGRVVQMEGERMAVYRDESGTVHAVSPVCTHAQCIVHWNSSEKTWDCPCHGSRFEPGGKVIEGPAVKDLEPAKIRVL